MEPSTSFNKLDNEEHIELRIQEVHKLAETRVKCILEFIRRKIAVILLVIGFVVLIALVSLSIGKNPGLPNNLHMLLLNVSQGTAEVDLKLKKTQEDTKREFAALKDSVSQDLVEAKSDHDKKQADSRKELSELKDSGLEMAKNLDELQDQLLNVSGTLAKVMAGIEKGQAGHREELLDLQDSLAALRAMGNNWTRSVLQELGAARHGQETIGTDVKQLLKEMKNITEHFCTSCPTGWKSFEKSCYFWSSERKSWMEAERACAKDEAYLAIINNVAEQKFLMSYVNEPNVYWIGLSDRGNEGTWVWVDGSLMVLSFWGEGEPNNVGDGEGEDCASLRFNGKWNDALCSVREVWICERAC